MRRLACALAMVVAVVVIAGAKQEPIRGGSELALTMPANVTLKSGEATQVTVKIDRKGIDENVDVKFNDLPRGIKIDKTEQVVLRGEKGADFILIAMGNAEPGDHPVKVTVRSREFTVAQDLMVTIRLN